MKLKGAIFDLDGTLLDSMQVWERFGELYLASRGIAAPEGLAEILKAMSLPESAAYFRRTFGLPDTEREILGGFAALLVEQYRDRIPLKPHAKPFLEKLEWAGVKMCVATATDGGLARAALERLGLAEHIAFVLTCEEAGLGKADPAFFRLALNRLGTEPRETTVFEDALHALSAAKAAGLFTVGVYDASAAADWPEIARNADRAICSFEDWEDGWDG